MIMKSLTLILALAACAAAQGMAGLPACARECATDAIPSECHLIQVECICSTSSFISDMACCVGRECNAEDQQTALEFANQICGGAGVTDLPQTATCADNSSTATSATAGTTASSSGSDSTETSATPTPTDTTSTGASTTETGTAAETETETNASEPTATPDSASILRGKEMGLLAGIAAGVAFLM